jgi:hypothetical protein
VMCIPLAYAREFWRGRGTWTQIECLNFCFKF